VTGAGLTQALSGVDGLIECGNAAGQRQGQLDAYFRTGSANLTAAARDAGVARMVLLSIVGIDKVPMKYYRAKLGQEEVLRNADVPCSVVRATQFHQFALQMLARMKLGPVSVIPALRTQPVATTIVARTLVDALEAQDPPGISMIGGPQEEYLPDLCRRLRAIIGGPRVIRLPLLGAAGRAIREGGLLLPDGPTGGPGFDDWLASLQD